MRQPSLALSAPPSLALSAPRLRPVRTAITGSPRRGPLPGVRRRTHRVPCGAGWADIGGGFNLNLRIDAEWPVVLRVHRPGLRRGPSCGTAALAGTAPADAVRVARPIPISGCDLRGSLIVGLSSRSSSITCSHGRTRTPTSVYSRSSDVFTLRSKQSGSPAHPNPSTTTEPSANCVTRSASHAGWASDPPGRTSRKWSHAADVFLWCRRQPGRDRRSVRPARGRAVCRAPPSARKAARATGRR